MSNKDIGDKIFDQEITLQNRIKARETNRTMVIHGWLRAHERMMQFRRENERERLHSKSPELQFWYGTTNRIVIGLTLLYSYMDDRRATQSSVSRATGMARGTVKRITEEAIESGMITEDLVPTLASQRLISDQVWNLVSGKEFTIFGNSLAVSALFRATSLLDGTMSSFVRPDV